MKWIKYIIIGVAGRFLLMFSVSHDWPVYLQCIVFIPIGLLIAWLVYRDIKSVQASKRDNRDNGIIVETNGQSMNLDQFHAKYGGKDNGKSGQ